MFRIKKDKTPTQGSAKARKFESIKMSVLMHFAVRNLRERHLRTFLTVTAVVIGVFAIFFLLSFGLGIQKLVTQQIIGNESIKSIDVSSANSKVIKLNQEAVNNIHAYSHVDRVGLEYSYPGSLAYGGSQDDVVVYGVDNNYQSESRFKVLKGALLAFDREKSVVVNQTVLRAMGLNNPADAIGKDISLDVSLQGSGAKSNTFKYSFKIVGVVESGSKEGGEVYVSSLWFDEVDVPAYSRVIVVADDVSNVAVLRNLIESNGYQTTSLIDTLTEINNIFKYFTIILVGFGSIGMVVAILGMFNSMTISLFERTKEIGLMMVLGARRSNMRKLFILEAMIISFIGATIGVILAIVTGWIINFYVNASAASRGVTQQFCLFDTPIWAILVTIFGTLFIGFLVVYWPARRAEKINPIDSLRRE